MADEIRLKAPTVEQQVNIIINGEEKLKAFSNTLDKISNNKNVQKYWKSQQELINATADAYGNFQKRASKDNATELIKVTNALQAMSGTDLSQILPDFDKISDGLKSAVKIVDSVDDAFSVKGFKETFDSFETLKAYGTDVQRLFSGFSVSTDVSELQENVKLLQNEVDKLTNRLTRAQNANEALQNEFADFKAGSGIKNLEDELDDANTKLERLQIQAVETFQNFLKQTNVAPSRQDSWGTIEYDFDDYRFERYFEAIENGSMTAQQAIADFKSQYAYLLEDSFKSNNNVFGLEQLQAFSEKLDSIFHQVEDTSNKISSIIENGVIAKSVQNLSEDTSLSDSQRSLFGNLLKDEESLKSITALFQKLIDESDQTKNTEVFNAEQFTELKELFSSIESSLSSIKGVLVDVGDGEELSPLLQKLEDIRKAASNIKLGLNMNIDSGTNQEYEAEFKKKQTGVLTAYQNLFKAYEYNGGDIPSEIWLQLHDFNTEEIDKNYSVAEKIAEYENALKRIGDFSKKYFYGTDYTKNAFESKGDTFKPYWNKISAAKASFTRFKNSTNVDTGDNPLSELFGNTKELNQVVEKLGEIADKLDELSASAKTFAESFSSGLNVTASVAEIETLTNRVKELEEELANVKNVATTSSTPQVETNISSSSESQIKIQNQVTESIQEQNKAIDESIKKTLTLNDVRQKQWEIIQKTNPKLEGTNSTWVDKPEDAKTFYEVNHKDSDYPFNENYSDDWTVKDKMNVEATGKITVYSSYPIEDGNWVTPSKEEGLSYAGSGKLYSATMDVRDIAWVDAGQGQVAHISDELKEVIDLSTKAETQVQSIDNKTNNVNNQSTLNVLDDTISKYETIVALVKEYYELSHNKQDIIGTSSDDERISEIRKQLKSYTQSPEYSGEYKMGIKGSGKNIFAKSVDLSQEEMLQEICNMLGVEIPQNAEKAKEAIKEVSTATTSADQMKDAFQPETGAENVPKIKENLDEVVQAENKVVENFQKIRQETNNAAESAQEYGKILSQVGLVGMQYNDEGEQIPSKYSYTRQTGKNQVQTITVKYEKDEESGEIVENEYIGDYITGFQALEKEIDKADKKVADLKKKLEVDKIKLGDNYDTSALETSIENAEADAEALYKALKTVYDQQSDYEYSIIQYDEERAKKQAAYNTELQNAVKIEQARQQNASDKKAIADAEKYSKNVEQSNRTLNRQKILIDEIEKTYNKDVNGDLNRFVSNPDDLNKLAEKKAEIQDLIDKLKNQGRDSSNEQDYLDLDKYIAEYKQLAKDKLKANNPSKQQLGGQKLQVSLEQQVAQYNELIAKAEKFGDVTSGLVTKLKEQREQIAEMNSNGIYTAKSGLKADDYNNARDNYKIGQAELKSYSGIYKENANGEKEINKIIAALEKTEKILENLPTNSKLDNQFLQLIDDVDKLNQKLQDGELTLSQYKDEVKTITSEYSKAVKAQNQADSKLDKETQSTVNKALKDQVSAWKQIQSIREKISKEDNSDNIAQLQETKKYYQEQYIAAQKIVKANQDRCDYQAQINRLQQIELETTTKIKTAQNDKKEKERYNNKKSATSLAGKFNKYTDRTKYTKEFTERADDYVKELKVMQFTDPEDLSRLKQIETELDKIEADSKLLSNKVIKQKSIISDYITQVELYAAKNNNMTAAQKSTIDKIIADLKTLYNSGEIVAQTFEDIQISFNDLQVNIEKSGKSGKNLITQIGDRLQGINTQFIAQFLSWQDFIRYAQEGISVVRELNTALTEMRKVSSESVQTLKDYQATTFGIADAVGTTAKQIQNSTADWMRLGESMNDAAESAKVANVLLNVSEFEGIDEATESLVSMSQAYKDLDKMDIVDVLNNIGKHIA